MGVSGKKESEAKRRGVISKLTTGRLTQAKGGPVRRVGGSSHPEKKSNWEGGGRRESGGRVRD